VFPFLSLEDVNLDAELAQRLPRRLAYYHLALPLAQDADGITVVMAHPENQQVVRVLEAALNAKIIPVRSFAETIRQRLDQVWENPHKFGVVRVLKWAQTADDLARSAAQVERMLAAFGREVQIEEQISPQGEFSPTASPPAADLVIAVLSALHIPENLFRTQASVLVLQDKVATTAVPRAILHALRGHMPDYRVLDWLVPFAQHFQAEVTLLMGVDGDLRKPLVSDLTSILAAQDKRHTHLMECRRMLTDSGIGGCLKLRQQTLLGAIQDELEVASYDLIAMAAEAYGEFAFQVWELIRSKSAAFLLIKP
jgi:hypothetical protein